MHFSVQSLELNFAAPNPHLQYSTLHAKNPEQFFFKIYGRLGPYPVQILDLLKKLSYMKFFV
jgi:hypothetical protein